METNLNNIFRKLFKGGGIIFLGYILDLSISFFAKVAIARVLGPVNYGNVYLGITVLTLATTLCLLGFQNGIARYLPRFEKDADKLGVFLSATYIAVPLSIIVAAGIVVSAPIIAELAFQNSDIAPYLRVFGLVVPFAVVIKLAVGSIQGLHLATPRVVIENIAPSISRMAFVAIAILLGAKTLGLALAYALAYIVTGFIGAYYLYRYMPKLTRVSPNMKYRELAIFSLPLIVSGAVSFLLNDLDTLMLGYYKDSFSVGIYNVIYPIAQVVMIFLSSFGFLFMPIISGFDAEGLNDKIKRIYQTITKWVFLFTVPILFVIVVFPDLTIRYTFGVEYLVGSTTLIALSIAFFSHAVTGPNSGILTAIGETNLIMWDNIFVALINALLNILLIPRYGFFGAGVATAISYAILNILFSGQVYLRTGFHPFSTRFIQVGVVSLVFIGIMLWLIERYLLSNIQTALGTIVVFLGIYSVIILRWGIEEQEVALLNSFEERFNINLKSIKKELERFVR